MVDTDDPVSSNQPLCHFRSNALDRMRWKKQATLGRKWSAITKMVFGSVVIAAPYLTPKKKLTATSIGTQMLVYQRMNSGMLLSGNKSLGGREAFL
jgi:hypothetical protein